MMVNVTDLKKTFAEGNRLLEVLKGTSFSMKKGEMAALVGVSGAGKTTLLQILGGLDKPTSGRVVVNSRDISTFTEAGLAEFRLKEIGFVFQFHHLLPDFTAVENVMMPGIIAGRKQSGLVLRAKELLDVMGLSDRFNHLPSELSGGERQRIALARALFNKPSLILADEPTGNLDKENSLKLIELIKKTNKELDQTYLVATHNEFLSLEMHRTIFIEDGVVVNSLKEKEQERQWKI